MLLTVPRQLNLIYLHVNDWSMLYKCFAYLLTYLFSSGSNFYMVVPVKIWRFA